MSRNGYSGGAALALLASAALLVISSSASVALESGSTGTASRALAATGDPVIAAAGDIACDPAQSEYNNGNGTSSACKQLATSNLIASDPSISAVLALGDNQNDCGGYSAYLQAFGRAGAGSSRSSTRSRKPRVLHQWRHRLRQRRGGGLPLLRCRRGRLPR